jgi:hypothetical protein
LLESLPMSLIWFWVFHTTGLWVKAERLDRKQTICLERKYESFLSPLLTKKPCWMNHHWLTLLRKEFVFLKSYFLFNQEQRQTHKKVEKQAKSLDRNKTEPFIQSRSRHSIQYSSQSSLNWVSKVVSFDCLTFFLWRKKTDKVRSWRGCLSSVPLFSSKSPLLLWEFPAKREEIHSQNWLNDSLFVYFVVSSLDRLECPSPHLKHLNSLSLSTKESSPVSTSALVSWLLDMLVDISLSRDSCWCDFRPKSKHVNR